MSSTLDSETSPTSSFSSLVTTTISSSSSVVSVSSISTMAISDTLTTSISASATAAAATNTSSAETNKSRLSPGTTAGVVIGGLLAGFVVGGCIVLLILVLQRRLRRRRSVVRTQPEERLMHLERMRGEMAPPLREGSAIQSLPPSRNIRVLNWLARTRNAGPPSVTQHTMSERSTHEDHRSAASVPLPVSISDSNSQSHYSQPSLEPRISEPQRSASTVVRPTKSDSRPSFNAMDDVLNDG
ncbi:hypothetical protein J3R30DRAFT_1843121 [Lentinula aciculospora]|uniref:Uncharacterized protein n=1 Tax=Lentinula aciculospora TaxID=153920 RepID=A0A9W9DSY9_9AGAR|nr:hypothetical protein J3R30DRAFT_1843121 [Lentinula aciculospora]